MASPKRRRPGAARGRLSRAVGSPLVHQRPCNNWPTPAKKKKKKIRNVPRMSIEIHLEKAQKIVGSLREGASLTLLRTFTRPGHPTLSRRHPALAEPPGLHTIHHSLLNHFPDLRWTLLPDRLYIVSVSELRVHFSPIYGPALPFGLALSTLPLLEPIQPRLEAWAHIPVAAATPQLVPSESGERGGDPFLQGHIPTLREGQAHTLLASVPRCTHFLNSALTAGGSACTAPPAGESHAHMSVWIPLILLAGSALVLIITITWHLQKLFQL